MAFDLSKWLGDFPVREECLYLDHAAVCPLPRPVAESMSGRLINQHLEEDGGSPPLRHLVMTCRHLGAELIGCNSDDISITKSTSESISLIARGLDWSEGDEVLIGEEEFAGNVAAWLALERQGVVVRRYPQPDGRIEVPVLERSITPKTRLLSCSWVSFHAGWVAPLAQISRLCRDRGVIFVVDAIQGLGVLPMDMNTLGIDAVVADSHKWMLGPEGIGLMATQPEFRLRLEPALLGWRNAKRAEGSYFLDRLDHFSDGRRFEPGSRSTVCIAGLAAALDLIGSVGRTQIQSRVEMLARLIGRVLIAHGWDVVSPGPGHPVAGIVAGRHPRVAPAEAAKRLAERRVRVAARQGHVRFSPHFYTTRGEIEALDRILGKVGL